MNSANLGKVRSLIATTQLLNDQEKAEWTQHLASMNDQQVESLIAFLTPKDKVAPPPAPSPPPPAAPTSLEKVMASVVAAHAESQSPKVSQPIPQPIPAPSPAPPQPVPPPSPAPQPVPKPQPLKPLQSAPPPAAPTGKMAQPKLAEYSDQLVHDGSLHVSSSLKILQSCLRRTSTTRTLKKFSQPSTSTP